MNRLFAGISVLLVLSAVAIARSEDGTLGVIRVPNNGQPAIVVRGERFTIRALGNPDIFVDSGGKLVELSAIWHELPGQLSETAVRIPDDFTPGLYSIVGVFNEVEDVQQRALLILDDAPSQYHIAHIPSPGIEAAQEASLASTAGLITIVTGDLTANGTADEYRTLLDWLNTSPSPTIIAPGKRDSEDRRFGDYFETDPHTTRCGRDAFITIGETIPDASDDVTGKATAYQILRRAMKPARWSIGISGYPHDALGLRSQIVLFVDTPLHAFVSGRSENSNEGSATVTWDSFQGATRILYSSDAQAPKIQWIHVTPAGVAIGDPPTKEEP